MKKLILFALLLLNLLPFAICVAQEADSAEVAPAWSGGLEMAATNRYIWHGIPVTEGPLFQPYAWITHSNLTFALWSNVNLTKPDDDIKRDEINVILAYEMALGKFSVTTEFDYYYYIDQPGVPNSGEIYLKAGYPFGIFTASAGVVADVIEYPGSIYLEQRLEATKELNKSFSLWGAVTLGSGLKKFNEANLFDSEDNPIAKSKVNQATLDLNLTYTAASGLYLTPFFQYNQTLSQELEYPLGKNSNAFGLYVGWEF